MNPNPETAGVPPRSAVPEELTWDLAPLYATPEAWEADFARLRRAYELSWKRGC